MGAIALSRVVTWGSLCIDRSDMPSQPQHESSSGDSSERRVRLVKSAIVSCRYITELGAKGVEQLDN